MNSCNSGQHRNLIKFLGKHNQEFPKNLGKLVINYFLPKLLVTYGSSPILFYDSQLYHFLYGGLKAWRY